MKALFPRTMLRRLSSAVRSAEARSEPERGKMFAWQIHGYGDLSELQRTSARVPHVNAPDELLVKVDAASVNPLDVAMIKGYGATAFNIMRSADVEFPLTLGRDFCGTVEWCGVGVRDLEVGSRVWGVLPPHWQGSHAQYTVARRAWVSPQPAGLSPVEAGSVLYAGLTAWSGLWLTAGFAVRGARGRRVLVLGAAGGVGGAAVQMLRAAGAFVMCSCSTDAIPLVQGLGADMIFDRTHADYEDTLKKYGPYDVILDCAGLGAAEAHARPWQYSAYVTFTTPLLREMDARGAAAGAAASAARLACDNARALAAGAGARTVRWAYFVPSAAGIDHLRRLVDGNEGTTLRIDDHIGILGVDLTHDLNFARHIKDKAKLASKKLGVLNKLRPVVDRVYGWADAPAAYQRVQDGHLRGKVVIDFTSGA